MEQLPIRLWYGFKRPELPHREFLGLQGKVVIPATVQALGRRLNALKAYMPVNRPERPLPGIPDQISLCVCDSVAAGVRADETLDGEVCQLMYDAVFVPPSGSNGFATMQNQIEWVEAVEFDRPYCISRRPVADFQKAHLSCLIGKRKASVGVARGVEDHNLYNAFRAGVVNAIYRGRDEVPEQNLPDLSVFEVSREYVVYFEVWSRQDIIPNGECLSRLCAVVDPVWRQVAAPVAVPKNLDAEGHWLQLSPMGDFINLQF